MLHVHNVDQPHHRSLADITFQVEKPKSFLLRLKYYYDRYHLRHFAPFVLLLIYSILGALLFHAVEHNNELLLLQKEQETLENIRNHTLYELRQVIANEDFANTTKAYASRDILVRFEQDLYKNKLPETLRWDFWGALFYVGTVFTTIGYGNITPRTKGGQALSMAYAVFGIPLVFAILSQFGKTLTNWTSNGWIRYRQWLKSHRKSPHRTPSIRKPKRKWSFAATSTTSRDHICAIQMDPHSDEIQSEAPSDETNESRTIPIWLALGLCIVYICLCAAMFLLWETRWSYFTSLYFIFISLSTIGLGDVVPDHPHMLILMFWLVVIGLSIVSMVLSVIQIKMEEWLYHLMVRMQKKYHQALATGEAVDREHLMEELMESEPWFLRNMAHTILTEKQTAELDKQAETYERTTRETNNKWIQTEPPPEVPPTPQTQRSIPMTNGDVEGTFVTAPQTTVDRGDADSSCDASSLPRDESISEFIVAPLSVEVIDEIARGRAAVEELARRAASECRESGTQADDAERVELGIPRELSPIERHDQSCATPTPPAHQDAQTSTSLPSLDSHYTQTESPKAEVVVGTGEPFIARVDPQLHSSLTTPLDLESLKAIEPKKSKIDSSAQWEEDLETIKPKLSISRATSFDWGSRALEDVAQRSTNTMFPDIRVDDYDAELRAAGRKESTTQWSPPVSPLPNELGVQWPSIDQVSDDEDRLSRKEMSTQCALIGNATGKDSVVEDGETDRELTASPFDGPTNALKPKNSSVMSLRSFDMEVVKPLVEKFDVVLQTEDSYMKIARRLEDYRSLRTTQNLLVFDASSSAGSSRTQSRTPNSPSPHLSVTGVSSGFGLTRRRSQRRRGSFRSSPTRARPSSFTDRRPSDPQPDDEETVKRTQSARVSRSGGEEEPPDLETAEAPRLRRKMPMRKARGRGSLEEEPGPSEEPPEDEAPGLARVMIADRPRICVDSASDTDDGVRRESPPRRTGPIHVAASRSVASSSVVAATTSPLAKKRSVPASVKFAETSRKDSTAKDPKTAVAAESKVSTVVKTAVVSESVAGAEMAVAMVSDKTVVRTDGAEGSKVVESRTAAIATSSQKAADSMETAAVAASEISITPLGTSELIAEASASQESSADAESFAMASAVKISTATASSSEQSEAIAENLSAASKSAVAAASKISTASESLLGDQLNTLSAKSFTISSSKSSASSYSFSSSSSAMAMSSKRSTQSEILQSDETLEPMEAEAAERNSPPIDRLLADPPDDPHDAKSSESDVTETEPRKPIRRKLGALGFSASRDSTGSEGK